MVAVLKPITARPIVRPTFDNMHVRHFSAWMNANLPALKTYYADLGRTLPGDENDNLTGLARAQQFLSFIQCQHDRERGVL